MKRDNRFEKRLEVVLWSIAFPGFGQFLNQKYIKALVLVFLEFLINVKGNINFIIVKSFLGEIDAAIYEADYLWVMFYPCIYLFAIWDAYRDAGGEEFPFMYVPFVFSAYSGTIGVIYSAKFMIFGVKLGPIFLGIIGMVLGYFIGMLIRRALIKHNR